MREASRNGGIEHLKIDERSIARHLYTNGLPELDLVIRTSGEMRLSNFLLWQVAYAEIYVTETLWPDFRGTQLLEAIEAFQKRERRFGGLGIDNGHALVKRVLTAVILIPIVVMALFRAPLWLFTLLVLGVALLAAREYLDIVEANGLQPVSAAVLLVSGVRISGARLDFGDDDRQQSTTWRCSFVAALGRWQCCW